MEAEKLAIILKLLGDKTRLAMIKILDSNECCVCEFVEIFSISQPAISQHIRKLKDIGIVKERRNGQWVHYSMNKDNEYYPLIRDVLQYIPNQDFRLQDSDVQSLRVLCE